MQKAVWVCDVCDEPVRYRRPDRNNKLPAADADGSAEIHPPPPYWCNADFIGSSAARVLCKKLYLRWL
jgi:hypothetical protein